MYCTLAAELSKDWSKLIALTNHACRSRHRQKVTLHRKKPSKTLRFEHGGRVTDGRGQLDFPDHASVHLEPPGYYLDRDST